MNELHEVLRRAGFTDAEARRSIEQATAPRPNAFAEVSYDHRDGDSATDLEGDTEQ